MADETTAKTDFIAPGMKSADPALLTKDDGAVSFAPTEPATLTVLEPEPVTAADRLRAFESRHLGEDAPRIGGKVERGHGSLFQRLSPEHRKAHEAIEKTAETERKLNEARAAVAIAESEHNAAIAAAEDASKFGI